MPLPPWRSPLTRALHRNRSRPDSRYLQLATLDPTGAPTNRTVVFRGFGDPIDSAALQFATDVRSDKVRPLADHPLAAVCWYFAKTREQFRLQGALRLVTASANDPWQHQRQQVWQAQSDKARQSYTWPSPGQPRSPQSSADFDAAPPDAQQAHPHFGLLVLVPTWVDHLELRGEPQNRYQYQYQQDVPQGDRWQTTTVNP